MSGYDFYFDDGKIKVSLCSRGEDPRWEMTIYSNTNNSPITLIGGENSSDKPFKVAIIVFTYIASLPNNSIITRRFLQQLKSIEQRDSVKYAISTLLTAAAVGKQEKRNFAADFKQRQNKFFSTKGKNSFGLRELRQSIWAGNHDNRGFIQFQFRVTLLRFCNRLRNINAYAEGKILSEEHKSWLTNIYNSIKLNSAAELDLELKNSNFSYEENVKKYLSKDYFYSLKTFFYYIVQNIDHILIIDEVRSFLVREGIDCYGRKKTVKNIVVETSFSSPVADSSSIAATTAPSAANNSDTFVVNTWSPNTNSSGNSSTYSSYYIDSENTNNSPLSLSKKYVDTPLEEQRNYELSSTINSVRTQSSSELDQLPIAKIIANIRYVNENTVNQVNSQQIYIKPHSLYTDNSSQFYEQTEIANKIRVEQSYSIDASTENIRQDFLQNGSKRSLLSDANIDNNSIVNNCKIYQPPGHTTVFNQQPIGQNFGNTAVNNRNSNPNPSPFVSNSSIITKITSNKSL